MSLKYRIAFTIFILEILMVGAILWQTTQTSLQNNREQYAKTDQIIAELLIDLARIALLTDEYLDFQNYIDNLASDPHIEQIQLLDTRQRIMAKIPRSAIGQQNIPQPEPTDGYWLKNKILGGSGDYGQLEILFSDRGLLATNRQVLQIGILTATVGIGVIAVIGLLMGYLLTRRLEMLTNAAAAFRDGQENVSIAFHGHDEIAQLGQAFHSMQETLTEKIQELHTSQQQLRLQAHYDTLTGLPNRSLLKDRLQHAIANALRVQHMVAILFIDLDRFKMINDSLGHAAGDILLQQVSERLKSNVRDGDTVARLGGDEFVIILENISSRSNADQVAHKILDMIRKPFAISEQRFFVNCSLGISLFPKDGSQQDQLLENADTALHRAKESGRNTVRFYSAEMNTLAVLRLRLENDLRYALERGELLLYFQPQLQLDSGHIIGVEALLRWQHPKLGLLRPNDFIELAEETGLIVAIGDWAIRQTCAQLAHWHQQQIPLPTVALNISTRQFIQTSLTEQLSRALADHDLDAQLLILEITESLLMQDAENAIETLQALQAMNIGLAIDDFGIGYSSLNYLKRLPIRQIKIDHSFVRDIATDPDDAAIVQAIIGMAHTLQLQVVAEGVETEEQLTFLRLHACDAFQGYIFSPPISAAAMTTLLRKPPSLFQPPQASLQQTYILLVDDDATTLELLAAALRQTGLQVLTADSARSGLQSLDQYPITVVVADEFMPEVDGNTFLKRVQCLYPKTIRIMISACDNPDTLITTISEAALYRFFSKPVQPEHLSASIQEALAQQSVQELYHADGNPNHPSVDQ